MSLLRRVAPALSVLLLLGACTDMDASDPSTAPASARPLGDAVSRQQAQVTWESVLRAGEATVRTLDAATAATLGGDRLLRLTSVDPDVTVFADRPKRLAGELRPDELLALWHGGAFGQDPPNAAVVFGDDVVSVELLGALHDPATATILFVLGELDDLDGAPAPRLPEGTLGAVTLFVDGTELPDGGVVNTQITDSVTQTNVKVLGQAPAVAMGNLFQATAQALGNAYENGQSAYQSSDEMQTSTQQAIALLEAMDTID